MITDVHLDPASPSGPFPPIHEGRYEVDPWATGLRSPVNEGLASAVSRAGIRLLRLGLGCWLPSQDPEGSNHADREWFTGRTLADADDSAKYNFAHLDRNLEVCKELGVELLFCFDYMPASLARPGGPKRVPLRMRPFAPKGYEFPNGVREAPTDEPEVFARACLKVLEHIEQAGVAIRYVELWNEPDLPFFYSGTYDEYFLMYDAFAHAVHGAGHAVGGPSWAGALEPDKWLEQFLRDCTSNATPLDFYSFHRYDEEVDKVLERCHAIRHALDGMGLENTELLLDEWGYDLRDAEYYGTVGNAAFIASCLMQLPDAGITAQTHVLLVDPVPDPALGRFHGLTRKDGDPNPIFFCMEAFEGFQSTPHRVRTTADDVVLAGVDDAGQRLQVLLANPDEKRSRTFRLHTPAEATGSIQYLTGPSFAAGGWSEPSQLVLGQQGADVVLQPGTMARVDASLA